MRIRSTRLLSSGREKSGSDVHPFTKAQRMAGGEIQMKGRLDFALPVLLKQYQ
jgi:hypothetical protein